MTEARGVAMIMDGFLKGIKEGMKDRRVRMAKEELLSIKKKGIEEERARSLRLDAGDTIKLTETHDILDETDPTAELFVKITDPSQDTGERLVGVKRRPVEMDPRTQKAQLEVEKLQGELFDARQTRGGNWHLSKEGKKATAQAKIRGFTVANPAEGIPSAESRKTLQSMVAKKEGAQKLIKKLIEEVKAGGPTLGLGESSRDKRLRQTLTSLKLNLKEVYQLGVLTGPDERLIDETIGDVVGKGAIFTEMVKSGSTVERLENLLDNLNGVVESEAEARGYKSVKEYQPISTGKFIEYKPASRVKEKDSSRDNQLILDNGAPQSLFKQEDEKAMIQMLNDGMFKFESGMR